MQEEARSPSRKKGKRIYKKVKESSHCGTAETNPTSSREDVGSIPGLTQWDLALLLTCGVGCRHSSDPVLLWFWCRLAAVAPIQALAQELSHGSGAALKKKLK